jgi:hypothetical protein
MASKCARFLAVALFLAGGVGSWAFAQPEDTIVVTAPYPPGAPQAFVGEISVTAGGEDQLARWDRRICPGVVGATRAQAQYILDRIAARAASLDLRVGEPGCRANIAIIISSDADELARLLVEEHRDAMGYYSEAGENARGREAFREFAETPRPVRWWHVAQTMSTGGQQPGEGASAMGSGGQGIANTIQSYSSSRLRSATRQDFTRAIIVVDGARLGGVTLGALSDYLAMVSLSQVSPDSDTSDFDTILNLFDASAGRRPQGLTEWDLAYLNGLYATPAGASSRQQQRAIGAIIERDLSAPPPQ